MQDYDNSNVENSRPMEIEPGDVYIRLPITLDYRGGRSENTKTQKIIASVLAGVTLLGIGFFWLKSDSNFFYKLIISSVVITIISYIIRFLLLDEQKLRNQYYQQLDTDYELDISDIWGIYGFEGDEIQIARFRNGYVGVFVYFEKDVIVGGGDNAHYYHHNAIQEGYKKAHNNGAIILDIDYMSFVGQDDRINSLYYQASQSENPELQSFLNRLYSHVEEYSADNISTFDVYCILMRGNTFNAKEVALEIIEEFLRGNYVGYAILDERSIKPLVEDIFNLHDFSVLEAERAAVSQSDRSIARAISIQNSEGITKLNKTIEENRKEQRDKEDLVKKIKEDRRRRRRENKQKVRENKNKKSNQNTENNSKASIGDNIIDL